MQSVTRLEPSHPEGPERPEGPEGSGTTEVRHSCRMDRQTNWDDLRSQATEVMRRAYVPYSRYPVGAAALVVDGRVVVVCNVENAGYGFSL